jgi:hypothetical protein
LCVVESISDNRGQFVLWKVESTSTGKVVWRMVKRSIKVALFGEFIDNNFEVMVIRKGKHESKSIGGSKTACFAILLVVIKEDRF